MIWKEINAKYVREGELLINSALIGDWWSELISMNSGKEGRPYEYPETFIKWASLLKTVFQRPYRQLEGFLRSLSKYLPIPSVPTYKTLERRIKKVGLDIVKDVANPSENCIIAMDSTGIKLANRSEWIRHKWKVKRGWLKLHVAVDIKTHQVLEAVVTTEETGDAIVGEHLLKEIVARFSCSKALADGAYDKNSLFDICQDNDISPAIKVRKNASTKRGNKLRRHEAKIQLYEGEDIWKQKREFGKRWIVEIWYAAYKRRFGEVVKAVSWRAMVLEILRNVSVLNWIYHMREL